MGAVMSNTMNTGYDGFIDRRSNTLGAPPGGRERRQFGNSYENLSPDARELAEAIDRYKLAHHRRFITCEELLEVITGLGYRKQT
jgi:hypothetical protein